MNLTHATETCRNPGPQPLVVISVLNYSRRMQP